MAKTQNDARPYHHGDLRRAIVKAALEILGETQRLEFSLRELARRADVSHNAPYKHFADKRELLSAVSAAGFDLLTKRMAREIGRHGNAREQLFAMLRAYIDHGVENPALYSLMFGGYLTGPNHGRPAIELAEAEKTKALLAGVIAAGGLGRAIPDTNERKIAGAILACRACSTAWRRNCRSCLPEPGSALNCHIDSLSARNSPDGSDVAGGCVMLVVGFLKPASTSRDVLVPRARAHSAGLVGPWPK
jgi:AcrR family transcriptional regulator